MNSWNIRSIWAITSAGADGEREPVWGPLLVSVPGRGRFGWRWGKPHLNVVCPEGVCSGFFEWHLKGLHISESGVACRLLFEQCLCYLPFHSCKLVCCARDLFVASRGGGGLIGGTVDPFSFFDLVGFWGHCVLERVATVVTGGGDGFDPEKGVGFNLCKPIATQLNGRKVQVRA